MAKLFNVDGYREKIMNGIKEHSAVLVLLLCSLGLRFYGIYFDYPRTNFIWDETYDMSYLMNVLEEKKLFSDTFTSSYPVLLPLLYFPMVIAKIIYTALLYGIHSVAELKNHVVEYGIGEIYIVSRWYAVAFGVATVFLIHRIYGIIFKNKVSALYAASAYAFGLMPVFISHWGKQHGAMVFFLTLSLLFILKFEREKDKKYFYWSALAAALSASTHYVGVSAAIFPLYGFLLNRKMFDLKTVFKGFCLYSGVTLFFYGLNYKGVLWMFRDVTANYYGKNNYSGIVPTGALERFYYVFRDSFSVEPLFMTFFIVLIVVGLRKLVNHRQTSYVLAGLAFNYLLMITIIVGPHMTRWLMTFITLSVPLAAGYFAEYTLNANIKKMTAYALLAVMLVPSVFFTARWLTLLRENTKIEAAAWLEKNAADGQIVYSFDDALYAPLSYDAAVWNREFNHMTELKKMNYIIEHREYFQGKGVTLMYDKGNERYEDLAGERTRYVFISYAKSAEKAEALNNLRKYHQVELAASFYPTGNAELAASGVGDQLNNPTSWKDLLYLEKSGSFVEIYKIL